MSSSVSLKSCSRAIVPRFVGVLYDDNQTWTNVDARQRVRVCLRSCASGLAKKREQLRSPIFSTHLSPVRPRHRAAHEAIQAAWVKSIWKIEDNNFLMLAWFTIMRSGAGKTGR